MKLLDWMKDALFGEIDYDKIQDCFLEEADVARSIKLRAMTMRELYYYRRFLRSLLGASG